MTYQKNSNWKLHPCEVIIFEKGRVRRTYVHKLRLLCENGLYAKRHMNLINSTGLHHIDDMIPLRRTLIITRSESLP